MKFKRFLHCFFAALIVFVSAHCSFSEQKQTERVHVQKEITYGRGEETDLKLDLAFEKRDHLRPAILFIHGGGWFQGDRSRYRQLIIEAAERGYVGITVSYRLMQAEGNIQKVKSATPNFPAQIHDVKAAVRWVRANAEKYQIDPNRIGVTGESAGGHLSLMLGLSSHEKELEGTGGNENQSSAVQAVVNVFGPTELTSCYETSSVSWIIQLFTGGTPEEVPERYRKASPVTYVSKNAPPILTLQGDKDKLVPVDQAKLLDKKMKKAGASHRLVIFEGQGHGYQEAAYKRYMKLMWAFFDQHLKSNSATK